MLLAAVEDYLKVWGEGRLPANVIYSGLKNAPEVLIFGNSRAKAGIIPEVLRPAFRKSGCRNDRIYNIAMGGTKISVQYFVLKKLIGTGWKPKYLIYGFVDNELTQTDIANDYSLAEVIQWRNLAEVLEAGGFSSKERDDDIDLVFRKLSRVWRYREIIRDVLIKQWLLHQNVANAKTDMGQDGFQDYRDIVRKTTVKLLKVSEGATLTELRQDNKAWDFKPEGTYLDKVVQLCSANNIKLLFVHMPVTGLHRKDISGECAWCGGYSNSLLGYLKKKGVVLLDLKDAVPDEDLPDTMHLSLEGAGKFSKILAQKISELGIVP